MATSFQESVHSPQSGVESKLALVLDAPKMKRRHDLDALRAIAMLLGIVLHAALAFAPIPWTVQDVNQSSAYGVMFAAIHGFRMPLFFLISGFFTAMLWRKRGLGGLINQRLQRILVPLVIGLFTIVPAMWAVSILAAQAPAGSNAIAVFDAIAAGDQAAVKQAIDSKAIPLDALHPSTGATLLTVASFYDQSDIVEMLLNEGADVNQKNRDAATALHVAIFMGHAGPAKHLLQAGADLNATDGAGKKPADNLKIDFATTSSVAQMYGVTLDTQKFQQGRTEIAEFMDIDLEGSSAAGPSDGSSAMLYGLLFQLPAFMHLWFLAFLCWLVGAFVIYAQIASMIPFSRIPKWLFCSPICLIVLVPLTMIPQAYMMPGAFGPDASIGLLPIPSVLAYYAIFFFYGAIYWELDDQTGMLGRWWYVTLPVAILIVFPLGLELVAGSFGFLSTEVRESFSPLWGNLLQAVFAWLMMFGAIGMFRDLFSGESKTMRYVSDSSYWLYLAHLPLVILAQWLVKDLPIPSLVKFVGITVLISAFLLLTYDWFIRYSFVGAILNGRKVRNASAPNGAR